MLPIAGPILIRGSLSSKRASRNRTLSRSTSTRYAYTRRCPTRPRRLASRAHTERLNAIAELRRFLELKLTRRLAHPLFQFADEADALLGRETLDLFIGLERHRHVIPFRDRHQTHVDRLHDRLRHDVVPLVIIHLHDPAAFGLAER